MHSDRQYQEGSCLVELVIVIVIIGTLITIALLSFSGFNKEAESAVCIMNCLQLENMYQMYLFMESKEHTGTLFTKYIQEYEQTICPRNGRIGYKRGKVRCSIHDEVYKNEDKDNDNDKGEICNNNCLDLEERYRIYLVTKSMNHTEQLFADYLKKYRQNICPSGGIISYVEDKVCCAIHNNEGNKNGDGSVPFL